MEKIQKIFATVLDRTQAEGGNCKVVGFLRDNIFYKDEDTINKYFPTESKIFSNRIYKSLPDLKISQLLEIVPSNINSEIEEGRNYYVNLKTVRKFGYLIIDVPIEYLNNDYIDLEELNNYFEINNYFQNDLNSFYLCDNEKLFGPFKNNNGKIQPKKDTFVYSFQYDLDDLIEVDDFKFSYLIDEPKNKINIVDCMTVSQLMDFLKNNLTIERADINLIKKTYDSIKSLNFGNSELDNIRLERASSYLTQLKFSYGELKKISLKEHDWSILINRIIDKNKEGVKEEVLSEIKNEIIQKEIIKNGILLEIQNINTDFENLKNDFEQLSNEYNKIEKNKQDLILSIQISAGANNSTSFNSEQEREKYYEVIASNIPSTINDLDEYYDQVDSKIKSKDLLKNTLYILKEKRFIIGNSVKLIINSIQHLGNYEIIIQNTEADWLKYKYFENSGLNVISQKAVENSSNNYFFILQDFNIASFECYGKPIIDIANGIRSYIPGTQIKWPKNLFIILITVDAEIDDFGFNINKSTFLNWTFLPLTTEYKLQNFVGDEGINLNKLEVTSQFKDNSENYFA